VPRELVESHILSTGQASTAEHWRKLAKHRPLPDAERCTAHTRRTDARRSLCSLCLGVAATTIRRSVPEPE
jgi:hypothetical protein